MQLPSRADHVGSLLRPVALREARARHAAGTLSAAAFRQIEDRYIREAIHMQEEIGLQAVTDGEYRRAFWHYDGISPDRKLFLRFRAGLSEGHCCLCQGRMYVFAAR